MKNDATIVTKVTVTRLCVAKRRCSLLLNAVDAIDVLLSEARKDLIILKLQ